MPRRMGESNLTGSTGEDLKGEGPSEACLDCEPNKRAEGRYADATGAIADELKQVEGEMASQEMDISSTGDFMV